MVNISQFGGQDDTFLADGIQEVAGVFEEPVVIQRFTGRTGGNDALMQMPTPQFTNIPTRANITALDAREINYPNSIYAIGDVRAEFLIPVYGAENKGGDKGNQVQADQVIWRGRTYMVIGHVMRPQLGGGKYYEAVLRQM